jgi:hypothetical protein
MKINPTQMSGSFLFMLRILSLGSMHEVRWLAGLVFQGRDQRQYKVKVTTLLYFLCYPECNAVCASILTTIITTLTDF